MTDLDFSSSHDQMTPGPLQRAWQWIRDGMTVTYPAKLHTHQRLMVAYVEAGVVPGDVAYCVEHKGQSAPIPFLGAEPHEHIIVNHRADCPIKYDPETDRFTAWCDCDVGLHLPVRTIRTRDLE